MTIPEQKGSPRRKSLLRRALRVIVLGGGLLFVFGGLFAIGAYLFWSYPAAMEARAELEKIRQNWGVGKMEEMKELLDLPEGERDLAPEWSEVEDEFRSVFGRLRNPDDKEFIPGVFDMFLWFYWLNPANPSWSQVAEIEVQLKGFEGILGRLDRIAEMEGSVRRDSGAFIKVLLLKNRIQQCRGNLKDSKRLIFSGLALLKDFEGAPSYVMWTPVELGILLEQAGSAFSYMDEGELKKLQEILGDFDLRSAVKRHLVKDTIETGDAICRGDYRSLTGLIGGVLGELNGWTIGGQDTLLWRFLMRLARPHDLARLYGNTNLVAEAINGPWSEMGKLTASDRFRSSRDLKRAGETFKFLMYYYSNWASSAQPRMYEFVFATEARAEVLMAVAGVERFRREKGELPGDLDELLPAYIPRAAIDPFTHGSLKYRIGDRGYCIYSHGADGEDDGGVDDISAWVSVPGIAPSSLPAAKIVDAVLELPGGSGPVLDVVFSPDGKLLVSSFYDGQVYVCDAASGKRIQTLTGHKSPALCLAFSPEGSTLLSAGGGWNHEDCIVEDGDETDDSPCKYGEILAWNTRSWEKKGVKSVDVPVTSIAYSPDGASVLVGALGSYHLDWPGFARYLNPRTLAWSEAPIVSDLPVNAVGCSPDGEGLGFLLSPAATAAPRRFVNVRDGKRSILSGSCLFDELKSKGLRGKDLDSLLTPIDFLPGEYSESETIELLSSAEVTQGQAGFTKMAFSPDGSLLAFGGWGGSVEIWDPRASPAAGPRLLGSSDEPPGGKIFRILAGHSRAVTSVAFSPDGKTLLSGSGDHTLRLWNVKDGRCLAIFEGHSLGVNAVAFSPDGKRIASASTDGSVRVWEVPSTE